MIGAGINFWLVLYQALLGLLGLQDFDWSARVWYRLIARDIPGFLAAVRPTHRLHRNFSLRESTRTALLYLSQPANIDEMARSAGYWWPGPAGSGVVSATECGTDNGASSINFINLRVRSLQSSSRKIKIKTLFNRGETWSQHGQHGDRP